MKPLNRVGVERRILILVFSLTTMLLVYSPEYALVPTWVKLAKIVDLFVAFRLGRMWDKSGVSE